MKKYFFNADGTIKLGRAIILVDTLTFMILILIFMGQFKGQDLTPRKSTTTTKKTTTTTIKVCKNCSIKFNRESMDMEPNNSYPLEDLLDLKNLDIHSVKFSISDTELADIELVEGKMSLVAKNTLGKFTLTAKYLDLEENLIININTSKLESISLKNLAYYIYPNEEVDIGIITNPVGYNIDNIKINIADNNIAEIVDNKKIKGKSLGSTKLSINNNGIIVNANVYVVNNKIITKVRENYLYQEKDVIEYTNKEVEILLQMEGSNKSLTNEDITPEIHDMGNFTTEVNFVSKSSSMENAYIYRLKFKSTSTKKSDDNYTLIDFKLSDGTKKEFKIERKQ